MCLPACALYYASQETPRFEVPPLTTTSPTSNLAELGLGPSFSPSLFTDWDVSNLLPALYIALVAFIAHLLLKRYFDPISRRAWSVFAILLLVMFGPVLVGGTAMLPTDLLRDHTPYRHLEPSPVAGNPDQNDILLYMVPLQSRVRDELAKGQWPVWNPWMALGMPLLADPQAQVLQPLVMLGYPFDDDIAAGVTAVLRVLLAMAGMYLFARRAGLSETPALIASTMYGLGGFLIHMLGWTLANPASYLPLGCYIGVTCVQRALPRDWIALALITASVLLSGHPETTMYAALTIATVTLWSLRQAPTGQRAKRLLHTSFAVVIGATLTAPILIPTATYVPITARYGEMQLRREFFENRAPLEGWQTARDRSERWDDAQKRLIPMAGPNVYGNSRYGEYWGALYSNEDAGGFVGTPALLALGLAFFVSRRNRFRGEGLLLILTLLALVVEARLPLLDHFIHRLPVLGHSSSGHRRLFMVIAFTGAFVAACTYERWRRSPLSWKRTIPWSLALAAFLLWATWTHRHPAEPTLLDDLRFDTLYLQLSVLAATTLLLTLRATKGAQLTAFTLVAVELVLIHGPNNPPSPRRLSYPSTPPLAFLQEQLNETGPPGRLIALHRALPPNTASMYGLADARIYNPMEPVHYTMLTRRLSPVMSAIRQLDQRDHPTYDLFGARYILTDHGTTMPAPLERVLEHESGDVWKRPRALPLAYLPKAILGFPGGDWSQWVHDNKDFQALSISVPKTPDSPHWMATSPQGSSVHLDSWTPDAWRCRVQLSEERFLATSCYQDGGWHALVDGRIRNWTPVNGPLLGVWLQPQDEHVAFLYRPPGMILGLLIAAFGLSAAVLFCSARHAPRIRLTLTLTTLGTLVLGFMSSYAANRLAFAGWGVVTTLALYLAMKAVASSPSKKIPVHCLTLGCALAAFGLLVAQAPQSLYEGAELIASPFPIWTVQPGTFVLLAVGLLLFGTLPRIRRSG